MVGLNRSIPLLAELAEEGNAILEQQLERELNLAFAVRGFGNHAGRGAGDSAIEENRIRSIEIRMVENVEQLRPELESQALSHSHAFEQRRVHVVRAWAPKRATRYVTERSGQRGQEGIGIEEPAGFPEPV